MFVLYCHCRILRSWPSPNETFHCLECCISAERNLNSHIVGLESVTPRIICAEKQTVLVVDFGHVAGEQTAHKQDVSKESETVTLPDFPTLAEMKNSASWSGSPSLWNVSQCGPIYVNHTGSGHCQEALVKLPGVCVWVLNAYFLLFPLVTEYFISISISTFKKLKSFIKNNKKIASS